MPNKKTSQLNTAGAPDGTEYLPGIQAGGSVKFLLNALKNFFGLQPFTALSGTSWDGSNKTLTLTANTSLTFSSTKRNGILKVKQDATGGRTLSINTVSVPVASGANAITAISFFYDDVAAAYTFSYDTNILGNVGGGGGDTTPPTVTSRATASTTTIVVNFSEAVTSTTAGWSFKKNGSPLSISSVSGSGTSTLTFTVATMASGDTLLCSYNSGTGDCKDIANNPLASFTDASVTNGIGGSYDTDAAAFFTAAGITDTTQKNAVNQLVLDLKSASLWTNMKALYPFVGGDATKHSFNLRNSAQYQITWAGSGVTHSSTGVDFDGVAGYGDTNAAAGTVAPNNAISFGTYLRQIGAVNNSYDFATYAGSGNNGLGFSQNQTGSGFILDNAGNVGITAPSAGLIALTTDILANGGTRLFNNGTYLAGSGAEEACTSTVNYILGALTTSFGFSNRQTALAFIYSGVLDDTQNSALYTAVQTFETALSRNV